jgi:MFS family permease
MVGALAFGVMTYAISQTLLVPSIRDIEHALHTSAVGATSLFTVFFVAGAVTLGILGRLGDMFGKRRIYVVQMVLFTVGAVTAALGTTLAVVLAGRAVMGCAAAVFPLSYSLLRDVLPVRRLPTVIGIIGGLAGTGAAIGQVSGGLVVDHLGYHWIFWISAVMGIVAIAAVLAFVPESKLRSPGRVDVLGALLLAAGLGAPLFSISQVPSWGWGGGRTLGGIALGLVLLGVFVAHERRHPDPLLSLETLMTPRVRLTNAATFLVGFSLFGMSVVISQFVQVPARSGFGFGASATHAGLFLVPGLLLMVVTSPVAARLSATAGPKASLVVGTVLGCLGLTGLALSHATHFELYLWPMFVQLGVGFAFGAAPLLILGAVPAELRGQSTAVNLILRHVGSSVGLQIVGTLIAASVSPSTGLPTEAGFTHSFAIMAVAAACALGVALGIPALRIRAAAVPPEAVAEVAALSTDKV